MQYGIERAAHVPARRRVFAMLRICAYIGFLAATAGTLTGCAQPATTARATPRSGEGGVLLKIGDNVASRGHGITVRRIPDASSPSHTCYELHVSTRGEIAGLYMGGALPPGNYEFPTIGASTFSVGECNQTFLAETHESGFGKFNVAPGKLTFLGTLERTTGPNTLFAMMVPMPSSASSDPAEIVREMFPDLHGLALDPAQGWVDGSMPAHLADVQKHALERSYGLFGPSETADGTWIFGTRTGMVRALVPGQRHATLHDTGRRVTLTSTAVLPDGSWLVGGEESTLMRSSDQGHTWQSIRGDLPFALIEHVASVGNDVMLTLVDGKDVSIYRGRTDGTTWQKLATFQTEQSFWTNIPGAGPQTAITGDDYFVSLPSTRLAVYHMAAGTSEVRNLPGTVTAFKVSGDGVLRCRCQDILTPAPFESHDQGKSWQASTFGRGSAFPSMYDAARGVIVLQASASDNPTFAFTTDGGRNWQSTSPSFRAGTNLFHSRDPQTAYASDGAGMLLVTNDGGKHWNIALDMEISPDGDTLHW